VSTTIITGDTLERSAMRELFNAGFSGYLVPMHLDEAAFETHLDRNDIDLTASPVLVDGDPVAFALVGIRDADAWIGGMGTVPAARRSGHAREVMRAAADLARARRCRSLWLEVIDANRPALALYERLGFETVRHLVVWRLAQTAGAAGASDAVVVPVSRARSWIAAHREGAEPWQRADPVIAKLERDGEQLHAIAVERGGELVGAAISAAANGSARMHQIAALDEDAASRLLRCAAGAGPLILGNVPDDDPASQAMARLGAELVARQHEMRLAL
jgi:ribosomal protein S18 acetylase RimI-like enzyme